MAIQYRLLTPADARLLSEGIRRVYGSTYPVPEFYDVRYLQEALQNELLHSVVALNAQDEVVGCMSTVLEQAADVTADGSALMIAPEYRGQGIVAQLGHHSLGIYNSLALGGLHLYALALHDLVQNQSGRAGAVVTGVLPAWFSRAARVAGYDYPDARIGAVTLYMPLGPLPVRTSYLPQLYAAILRDIYNNLPAERELRVADPDIQLPGHSTWTVESKITNRQHRLLLQRTGADLAQILQDATVTAAEEGMEVLYLDVALDDPGCNSAVEEAKAAGFFFGALMVDRRGCDHLRLQRYQGKLAAPGHMVVASPEAARLLEFVMADHSAS